MAEQPKTTPGPKGRTDAADVTTELLRNLRVAGKQPDGKEQPLEKREKLLTYDDGLAEQENIAARELKRLAVEEATARREVSIKRAKDEARKIDKSEDEETRVAPKPRWTIIDGKPVETDESGEYSTFAQALATATAMVRWTIVDGRPVEAEDGEYRTFAQALQVASMERRGDEKPKRWTIVDDKPLEDENGEYTSFTDAYKVAYLGILKKQATAETKPNESAEQIKYLTQKMANLEQQLSKALNPFEVIRAAKAYREELTEAGIIQATPAGPETGDPIELEKEKNRHAEEMQRLAAEQRYKESIADTLSGIPRAVGKGIGSDILKRVGAPSPTGNSVMERFNCENCGASITVGPGTMSVKCPQCGTVWGREPAAAPPAGSPAPVNNTPSGT